MQRVAEMQPNRQAVELFDGLPRRYDRLAYLLSFGQDRRWRRAAVSKLPHGEDRCILDVATGPGGVAFAVREQTGAQVVGVDLTRPMLLRARANIEQRGDVDIRLVQARAEDLPFRSGSFDGLSFSYLLRYVADPAETVAELARVVKEGAVVTSLEFFVPPLAPARAAWWFYTRFLLPLLGYLSGGREWFEVGRFLGPSISGHYERYPLAWHVRAWERAGFVDVGWKRLSLGGGLVMWGTKARGNR